MWCRTTTVDNTRSTFGVAERQVTMPSQHTKGGDAKRHTQRTALGKLKRQSCLIIQLRGVFVARIATKPALRLFDGLREEAWTQKEGVE